MLPGFTCDLFSAVVGTIITFLMLCYWEDRWARVLLHVAIYGGTGCLAVLGIVMHSAEAVSWAAFFAALWWLFSGWFSEFHDLPSK
jgi:hypothetical protein